MKKLQRDTNNFSNNRAYKLKRNVLNTKSRGGSVSSSTSMDSTTSSQYSGRFRPRGTKRKLQVPQKESGKRQERGAQNPDMPAQTLKVINLSERILTDPQKEVLGLGLLFSPSCKFDSFTAIKDLHLFAKKLLFKKFYHDQVLHALFPTVEERQAIETLQALLDEQEPRDAGEL